MGSYGIGAVAQLGERLVRNEEVSGSIPLSSTNLRGEAVKIVRPSLGEGGPDSFRRFDWQGQPSLT